MATASVLSPKLPAPRLWVPRRVVITPEALRWQHGQAIVERASGFGSEIIELKANRLTGLRGGTAREEYARAKTTLAVVVASESGRRLQPIPPSADWQFHIAEGCPAHCQYCYLAGSLSGPPVTRVYANLPEILEALPQFLGAGQVTSKSNARREEGTTFEVSCYTDPLGIEHLTGSLSECIRYFGSWQAPAQLRWTTKFDAVDPLLHIPHERRTRVRFSVNAQSVARNFEGGTASILGRLGAMRKMSSAGYPVGLTIAPIMPVENWRAEYRDLLRNVASALADIPNLDLTVEMITHRFTAGSKLVQLSWYPKTTLDFDESSRAKKMTKFGTAKFVYPKTVANEMRSWFESTLAYELPSARRLYWT